jgi:hypothetical protein
MSTFKPLKILASRRQVLKAGLAAITLWDRLTGQRERTTAIENIQWAQQTRSEEKGAKRVVMLDPGHGGIDTGAIGITVRKRSTSCWRSLKTCAAFCAATASMRACAQRRYLYSAL